MGWLDRVHLTANTMWQTALGERGAAPGLWSNSTCLSEMHHAQQPKYRTAPAGTMLVPEAKVLVCLCVALNDAHVVSTS